MTESELKEKVRNLGQFPYKRRNINYQSYWLGDHYERGSRDTLLRLKAMGISKNLSGKTVLDLGCQIGSICMEVCRRGAKVIGVDNNEDYLFCAEELAWHNKLEIEYIQSDLCDIDKTCHFINGPRFDIVFLLSMYDHIKEKMFDLLKVLNWKTAYIESNNCPLRFEDNRAKKMEDLMKGWKTIRIGIIEDRGIRCLWRLDA